MNCAPADKALLRKRLAGLLGTRFGSMRTAEEDAAYQSSFAEQGEERAKPVLEAFQNCVRVSNEQRSYAYLSIGGSDGAEIAWALQNSEICHGVLLEQSSSACETARTRIADLSRAGKELIVVEGDAQQKLAEALGHCTAWRDKCQIDGLLISIQSLLHELPSRSKGFDTRVYLANLLRGWDRLFFYSREPCGPQNWPNTVEIRVPGIPGDQLKGLAILVKEINRLEGDIEELTDDWVQMPAVLAGEVLFKLLYYDNTINYELEEQLTGFEPKALSKHLRSHLGEHSIQLLTSRSSDRYMRTYRDKDVQARDRNGDSLDPPQVHAVVAAYRTSKVRRVRILPR